MSKKKSSLPVPVDLVRDAQEHFVKALATDPLYSTEPDPEGILGLSDEQKNFLKAYIDFKNIPTAAQLAKIDETTAQKYFFDPVCRKEIRRINLALYYRKFSRRLLTIDELGGYLTSMLVDLDVSEVEKLKSRDKLDVVKLLIELNKLKAEAYNNPKVFDNVDYVEEVRDLSPDELRQLIDQTIRPTKEDKKNQEAVEQQKAELIQQLNEFGYLDPSEIAFLQTCSVEELEELIKTKEAPKHDD